MVQMIPVSCHTNLDLHMEKWPDELPCRPVVGDIIVSEKGLELQVVRVTFKKYKKDSIGYLDGLNYCLDVELHLVPSRFENISHFEIWYRNIFSNNIDGVNGDFYRKQYNIEMASLHESMKRNY